MRPRRYQLTKHTAAVIERGHPWIFRDQLSSAASALHDGDWLALFDGANRVIAHGIFEASGAIAIRVLSRGPQRPRTAWLRMQLAAAAARRAPLSAHTNGLRLVHGESDNIPAVVVDRFGDTLVATSYSAGADALARYAALALSSPSLLAGSLPTAPAGAPAPDLRALAGVTSALFRPAHRRLAQTTAPGPRVLRGAPPPIARFTEENLTFEVDLAQGQKTGTYLDLRALRRAIATAPLSGARVLNLFAYTGMLGRAAESAGATEIVQVDASEHALAFAAAHHVTDPARHRFVTADVLTWLPAQPRGVFDLVIVDPPSMTSRKTQIPSVLAAYRKLYRAASRQVRPGGILVASCCTSRVPRGTFHRVVAETLGPAFTRELDLSPEPDHPVGFAEADYLKIGWWRRAADAPPP